jgi:predicted RNase H-like HicB family nuclease
MAGEIQTAKALEKAVQKLDEVIKVGHEIAEIIPHSEKKGEIIQVAGGSKASVAMQESLVMAQYQMLNNAFGFQPGNFKIWAKNFEECFPLIKKNSPLIDGNVNGANPWLQGISNRPLIKILNITKQEKEIPTYLYIEFYPERKNESEVYFIEGTQIDCVQRIWHIWYLRQILKGMNLAQVLGEFPDDWLRKRPSIGISVCFKLYSYADSPFYKTPTRKDFKEVQITVPMVDRTKLSYGNIRQILGGENGMPWGLSKALAWCCDNPANFAGLKGMPQVSARGSSYTEAKSNVKRILEGISNAKIVRMNEGRPDNEEIFNKDAKFSPPARVYPGLMWILNSNLVNQIAPNSPKRETTLGKLRTKRNRIEIWHKEEPLEFKETIQELTIF